MHPCMLRPLLHVLYARHSRLRAQRCSSVKYVPIFALLAPCSQGASLLQSTGAQALPLALFALETLTFERSSNSQTDS
jgi:hypothetical protein